MKYNLFENPFFQDKRRVALLVAAGVVLGGIVAVATMPDPVTNKSPVTHVLQPVPAGMMTLRGEGTLPDLHVAQQNDAVLKDMVTNFAAAGAVGLLSSVNDLDNRIMVLLFRWGGVDNINPDSYGGGMDGRIVALLQKAGQVPADVRPDMVIKADEVVRLTQRWNNGFNHFKIRLLAQAAGPEVFDGQIRYDVRSDRLDVTGGLSPAFMAQFARAVRDNPQSASIMAQFLDFIDSTRGFANLSEDDQDAIMALSAGPQGE